MTPFARLALYAGSLGLGAAVSASYLFAGGLFVGLMAVTALTLAILATLERRPRDPRPDRRPPEDATEAFTVRARDRRAIERDAAASREPDDDLDDDA